MAKIKSFEFKNVRSYGNQLTKIPFDMENGLVLILGENGHGKTSICEALEYGIYGKSSRVQSKNLPNWFNGNMFTNLTFETDDKRVVKLSRGLSPDYYKLSVDDNTTESKDKSGNLSSKIAVDKYVENELFGIPFDVFSNNILLSIHDFKSFINMKAADKRKIIDKIFDTDIFNKMLKDAKDDLKIKKDNLVQLNAQYTAKSEAYNSLVNRIEELKNEKDDSLDARIESLSTEIRCLEDEIKTNQSNVDNYMNTLRKKNDEKSEFFKKCNSDKSSIISEYDKKYNSINSDCNIEIKGVTDDFNEKRKSEIGTIDAELESEIGKITTPEAEIESVTKLAEEKRSDENQMYESICNDVTEEFNRISSAINSKYNENVSSYRESSRLEQDKLKSELESLKETISNMETEISDLCTGIYRFEQNIENINEKLSLYEKGKCPTCGSDLIHDEFHKHEKETLLESLDKSQKELNSLNSEKESKKSKLFSLVEEKNKLDSKISEKSIEIGNKVSAMESDFKVAITSAKYEYDSKISNIKSKHDEKISKIDGILNEAFNNAKLRYDEKCKTLRVAHAEKYTAIVDKYTTLVNESVAKINEKYDKLRSEIIEWKESELEKITASENEFTTAFDTYYTKLNSEIDAVNESLSESRKKRDEYASELNVLKSKSVDHVLNELNDQSELLHNEMNSLNTQILKENEEVSVMEDVSYVIGDEGIKKSIMGRILPSFNEMIQRITQKFDFKYRFIFDDEFNCHMSFCGQPVPISTSRGEEKIMDIIVLLSTLKLILMKHKSVNILFLDEIFSNLDVNNIAKAVSILKEYSREYNLTIFVMSHTTVPVEMFDEIITVKNDGTFSHLEIEK